MKNNKWKYEFYETCNGDDYNSNIVFTNGKTIFHSLNIDISEDDGIPIDWLAGGILDLFCNILNELGTLYDSRLDDKDREIVELEARIKELERKNE